ncbi:MAG: hypothetical protein RIC15_07780 [Vicingaceae bacterium]
MSTTDPRDKKSQELNESELDNVTGGAGFPQDVEPAPEGHEPQEDIDPTAPVEDHGPNGPRRDGKR